MGSNDLWSFDTWLYLQPFLLFPIHVYVKRVSSKLIMLVLAGIYKVVESLVLIEVSTR